MNSTFSAKLKAKASAESDQEWVDMSVKKTFDFEHPQIQVIVF